MIACSAFVSIFRAAARIGGSFASFFSWAVSSRGGVSDWLLCSFSFFTSLVVLETGEGDFFAQQEELIIGEPAKMAENMRVEYNKRRYFMMVDFLIFGCYRFGCYTDTMVTFVYDS